MSGGSDPSPRSTRRSWGAATGPESEQAYGDAKPLGVGFQISIVRDPNRMDGSYAFPAKFRYARCPENLMIDVSAMTATMTRFP